MSFPSDVDVFLIEWPHVAMQMTSTGPKTQETVDTIIRLLKTYNHEQACFVAHSLGMQSFEHKCVDSHLTLSLFPLLRHGVGVVDAT